MSQTQAELYLLMYPVTDERMYKVLTDKESSFPLSSWLIKEIGKGDKSTIPTEKLVEISYVIDELTRKKYITQITATGGSTYKPTMKWHWNNMVTHKTLTFFGVVGTFLGIIVAVVIAIVTYWPAKPKAIDLPLIKEEKVLQTLPDTSHTKLPALQGDTFKK